ncbi:MAG: hypothetical protein ACJA1P_002204 [Maribacter sp.]|jgi:hypothetical protein
MRPKLGGYESKEKSLSQSIYGWYCLFLEILKESLAFQNDKNKV